MDCTPPSVSSAPVPRHPWWQFLFQRHLSSTRTNSTLLSARLQLGQPLIRLLNCFHQTYLTQGWGKNQEPPCLTRPFLGPIWERFLEESTQSHWGWMTKLWSETLKCSQTFSLENNLQIELICKKKKKNTVSTAEIDWVGDTELVSMITVVWLMIIVWFQKVQAWILTLSPWASLSLSFLGSKLGLRLVSPS